MILLQIKTALITGAGGGIGRAIATAYAEHGARVILADLAAPDLTSLDRARALALNVTDEAATISAFDALARDGWTPDIVVPNAGILHLASTEDIPTERFEAVLRVNLTGAFLTAKTAIAHMGAGGRIIFTSSLFGRRGGAGNAAYAASKFGMVGLMESMAADLAPRGLLVNAIAPGQIETAMMEKLVATRLEQGLPDPRKKLLARIPMGRLGTPRELTGTYVWLASDLSDYVTGQTIIVDGGWQVG